MVAIQIPVHCLFSAADEIDPGTSWIEQMKTSDAYASGAFICGEGKVLAGDSLRQAEWTPADAG